MSVTRVSHTRFVPEGHGSVPTRFFKKPRPLTIPPLLKPKIFCTHIFYTQHFIPPQNPSATNQLLTCPCRPEFRAGVTQISFRCFANLHPNFAKLLLLAPVRAKFRKKICETQKLTPHLLTFSSFKIHHFTPNFHFPPPKPPLPYHHHHHHKTYPHLKPTPKFSSRSARAPPSGAALRARPPADAGGMRSLAVVGWFVMCIL